MKGTARAVDLPAFGFRPHLWGNIMVEARSLSFVVTEPFPLSGVVQSQFCHLLHSNDF